MKKILLLATVAACGMWMISCGNNAAQKEAQGEEKLQEEMAQASGEPIVLGPDDILEFGGAMPAPVVVDFWADWCPPCKELSPIFHKVADKYKGQVRFISVNVDKCTGIAKQYGVSSIPTLLFVDTQGVINRSVGFMTEEEMIANVESIMPSTEPKIAPR